MKKLFVSASALCLSALAATPACAASFIGDQMKTSWRLPTETSQFSFSMSPSKTFTVGKGAEGQVQLNTIMFLVDFGVNSLTFTFINNGLFASQAFNGIYFDQLGDGDFGDIASVSGIAASRLHNMGKSFSVNFAGQRYAAGDKIVIDFVPDVPEPARWAMMIAGFALVGGAMRRRATASALG